VVAALTEVTIEFAPASSTAIVGRSGSGKSTLVSVLALLRRPTSGTVRVGAEDTSVLGDDQLSRLRGRLVGTVFQSFHRPARRVLRQVGVPRRPPARTPDWRGDARAGLSPHARPWQHLPRLACDAPGPVGRPGTTVSRSKVGRQTLNPTSRPSPSRAGSRPTEGTTYPACGDNVAVSVRSVTPIGLSRLSPSDC
jgi:ABC-type oligopeptide transport system ATPase subunit